MKNWSDIEIDNKDLILLHQIVKESIGINPACSLRSCWTDKMNHGIEKAANEKHRLGYGFVGDGFPVKKDQPFIPMIDKMNLSPAFPELNYRDVGDAIYQGNILLPLLDHSKRNYVVDFGSGYGRLALPFIWWAMKNDKPLTYIGVDFSPSGLLTAGQFVEQAVEGCVVKKWYDDVMPFDKANFVSLPAWRIHELTKIKVDLFITVHSFQEMTDETIAFYIDISEQVKTLKSLFFSINYNTDFNKFEPTKEWQKIFDRPYFLTENRDGSFNEVLWRM